MFQFNGVQIDKPGAYGIVKILRRLGVNFPAFNVGLIIAPSMKGAPYNSNLNNGDKVMLPYSDAKSLAKDYGYDTLFRYFKRMQNQYDGAVFVLNSQPNTPVSATLADTTPTNSLTMKAMPKNYGVFGNDIQVNIADSGDEDTFIDSGTATGSSSTTIVDSGKSWTTNAHTAKYVKIVAGTGLGQIRKIASNTGTTLTVSAAWTTTPDTTSQYQILQPKWQVTIIPTMNEKMIVEDVTSGQNYIYVNSLEGVSIGAKFALMNNPTGFISYYNVSSVVTKYNSTKKGFKVVFDSAIASSAITKANYARICQFDTDNQILITFSNADWTIDNIVAKLNQLQKEIEFSKHASAVGTPASTGGNVYLGQISGATKGTNPTAIATDYLNIANYFPDWSDEFLFTYKVDIRIFGLATPDNAVHAAYKTLAKTMGGFNYKKPMGLVLGNDLNESADDCVTRLKALNYDHTLLCLGGDEDLPAYLTTAPEVFGTVLKYGPGHNLTRDLINITNPEKNWKDTEVTKLLRAGGIIFLPFVDGYRIGRGLTTYQDQTQEWNEQDGQSYLWQQVQLSDFFQKGMLTEMDRQAIGVDDITQEDVSILANGIVLKYATEGYIQSGQVMSVTRVESGWIVKFKITIQGVTDFIGVVTYLQAA